MKKDIIKVMKDEESGKKVEITQKMVIEYGEAIARYREGVKKTNHGIFDMILSVGEMIDKKLYLAAGYTSVESFAVGNLEMSRSHAYNFYNLYKKLPPKIIEMSVQRLDTGLKALSFQRFMALPNDHDVLEGLSESDMEAMAGMSDAEFDAEMAKLKKDDYDRGRDGGRGPSDVKRALISRARYRDQLKKIQRLREKYDTTLDEKDELVGEIEKMEKLIADLKRITSPDKNKNEMIQDNKALLFEVAELKKRVQIETRIENLSRVGMKHVLIAIGECQIVFNKIADIELHSHQEWVEFRVMTDTIRQLLDTCEDHVGFTMAEKSLNPKEYEEWHDGSFKYHLDKATEEMKKEYIKKDEERIDNLIEEAKKDRKKKREDSAKNTSRNT